MESKIDQNATYEFLIFIDISFVFIRLFRFGGFYVRLRSALFSRFRAVEPRVLL